MAKTITVSATVHAPIAKVWEAWNKPEHIVQWAFASDDWEAPAAENDLKVGGRFKTTMAAKDKSAMFDLTGTYTAIREHELIEYTMDGEDARKVSTTFKQNGDTTDISTTFDMENENSVEMQRGGWQAILNNFKKHAESI
ncbi:SRPBCC family protein [Candidatus Microgenomates bacterium]|nr:SRPBCC family protein [Candidatus Microgenomates bacterium]